MAYVIDQDKCEKDDHCLEACPVDAIERKDDGSLLVTADECTECGACESACDFEAIQRVQ